MENILKCYVGLFFNQKLPIPFLLNSKDSFEDKLGDMIHIDNDGYATIQLNNKGIKHFNQKKGDNNLYIVPPIIKLPEIRENDLQN